MYIVFLGLVADRIISMWSKTKKESLEIKGRLLPILIFKVN